VAAIYNECDPFAAAWLRELIKRGLIAEGLVDERPIQELKPSDVSGFTQFHAFAGIGVWSYALRQAGWPDDRPVWTGSCPCQPFSVAGRGRGVEDERHLWPEWFGLIRELRPATTFGEQSSSNLGLSWLDGVAADLESEGYAIGAASLLARHVGAPHLRRRLFFVADPYRPGLEGWGLRSKQSFTQRAPWSGGVAVRGRDGKKRLVEPGIQPLVAGIAGRVDVLRGAGNSLCAPQAQAFVKAYLDLER
jgi:DNA (cytosine-5)-methyltransferase 1